MINKLYLLIKWFNSEQEKGRWSSSKAPYEVQNDLFKIIYKLREHEVMKERLIELEEISSSEGSDNLYWANGEPLVKS